MNRNRFGNAAYNRPNNDDDEFDESESESEGYESRNNNRGGRLGLGRTANNLGR